MIKIKSDDLPYIAISLSVISIILNVYISKKRHSFSIKDKYFSEIFDELLIKDIPIGYAKITEKFDKDKIYDLSQTILDAILELKNKIVFFKFYQKRFYQKVDNLLRASPLQGIPLGRTTSKADIRSVETISSFLFN